MISIEISEQNTTFLNSAHKDLKADICCYYELICNSQKRSKNLSSLLFPLYILSNTYIKYVDYIVYLLYSSELEFMYESWKDFDKSMNSFRYLKHLSKKSNKR